MHLKYKKINRMNYYCIISKQRKFIKIFMSDVYKKKEKKINRQKYLPCYAHRHVICLFTLN